MQCMYVCMCICIYIYIDIFFRCQCIYVILCISFLDLFGPLNLCGVKWTNMDSEFTVFLSMRQFCDMPAGQHLSVSGLFFADSRSFFWKEIHESDKTSFSRWVPCGMWRARQSVSPSPFGSLSHGSWCRDFRRIHFRHCAGGGLCDFVGKLHPDLWHCPEARGDR